MEVDEPLSLASGLHYSTGGDYSGDAVNANGISGCVLIVAPFLASCVQALCIRLGVESSPFSYRVKS